MSDFCNQNSFDLNEIPSDIFPSPELLNSEQNPPIESTILEDFQVEDNDSSEMETGVCMSIGNKRKNFTIEQKKDVIKILLQRSELEKLNKLPSGILDEVAGIFSISRRSVSRLWSLAKSLMHDGTLPDLDSKLLRNVGRKRVEFDCERIKDVLFQRRTNIRSASAVLNISKSTFHRRIKEGSIQAHSNSLKPYLTDQNMKSRLKFCLSMVDGSAINNPRFLDMNNQIHIDEKWYYMSRISNKYYLHPNEEEPHRTCKSKRFITKIMFLAAVSRPQVDKESGMSFDGKIGIWPFVFQEAAKRNSRNRRAGTMETKPLLSVTKETIRSFLIEKLLPAIKEKWPPFCSKTIMIQQDNAKPHLDINDFAFTTAANTDGFKISLYCQPPNSPDMNVLDLGFFRAIDSLQHQEAPTTIDQFIMAVENAYQNFPEAELNNIFLTLQSCMVEVMKVYGGNNYKIPHMKKHSLMRKGELKECVEFDNEVLIQARAALNGEDGSN
ncbi:uncharacterized protein LOC126681939 [Mercurialis annua]|uniref:uncharacterized protein LOC126681939 n=1 Tax=Mercurialis annua TaxID=3986 RepID=UPI00216006D7|nr:uncharacterized protein LOC126681939 [Mercurialis annua]